MRGVPVLLAVALAIIAASVAGNTATKCGDACNDDGDSCPAGLSCKNDKCECESGESGDQTCAQGVCKSLELLGCGRTCSDAGTCGNGAFCNTSSNICECQADETCSLGGDCVLTSCGDPCKVNGSCPNGLSCDSNNNICVCQDGTGMCHQGVCKPPGCGQACSSTLACGEGTTCNTTSVCECQDDQTCIVGNACVVLVAMTEISSCDGPCGYVPVKDDAGNLTNEVEEYFCEDGLECQAEDGKCYCPGED